jgi:hypothetical protein
MIVACAQMHMAFQTTIFTSDNQNHFGVSFLTHDTINYYRACFLQKTGKLNILFRVKSRPEFNNNGNFFAISRRLRQCLFEFL